MKIDTVHVNKENRFTIAKDVDSEKSYIGIAVSNGLLDYYEYYHISDNELKNFQQNDEALIEFVNKCKSREMDERLLRKQGRLRGEP